MDRFLISELFKKWAGFGGTTTGGEVTTANVLDIFEQMMVTMTEERVPEIGRVLYVTPVVSKMLRQADAVDRTIDLRNRRTVITTTVDEINGVRLEVVPSDLMKTEYDFTNGSVAKPTAKQINMVLGHNSCVATPVKYNSVRLDPPSAVTDDKWVYFERAYEDAFVLKHKVPGLQFNVSAKTTKTPTP